MLEGWCDWKMYDDSHFALGVIAGNRQHICSSKNPTKLSDFYATEILDPYYKRSSCLEIAYHSVFEEYNHNSTHETNQVVVGIPQQRQSYSAHPEYYDYNQASSFKHHLTQAIVSIVSQSLVSGDT
jgi:hypothetical protein